MDKLLKFSPWILLLIACWFWLTTCKRENTKDNLYAASQDTLKLSRNKLGEQEASIAIFSVTNQKQFLELKSNDSTINKLKQLVRSDKHISSATVITNQTSENFTQKATVIRVDTVKSQNGIEYIYKEDSIHRINKWEDILIKVNRDSISVKYKIFNEFDIAQTLQSSGWFKDKIPIIKVLNLNPNTETKELRTFTIKTQSNKVKNTMIGGALGLVVGYLLFHK